MPPDPALMQAFLAHRDMNLDDNMLKLAPQASAGRTRIKGTDPRVRAVADTIGRGTMPSPRESVAGGGKVKRTRITGRGQVPQAWDEEGYRYHYSPEKNFEGIRERGFDPSLKQGYSKGTHFMPGPDYPALEDNPGNYYRVRQDVAPFKNVSTDDFYTERAIAPKDVEVYTGTPEMPTRWTPVSNAYGKANTGMGLYNMLASFFPGKLPSFQGPSDWVIQDVLRNMDASPWNPENQMGYTTLA